MRHINLNSSLLFAIDAACQPWARSRGLPTDARWASLAGDTSLGLSVDRLQFDSEEGQGSYLFDTVVEEVQLDISPSQHDALSLEIWVRVNSFAGTSNGWIIGQE